MGCVLLKKQDQLGGVQAAGPGRGQKIVVKKGQPVRQNSQRYCYHCILITGCMHNRQAEQAWLVALRSDDSGALRAIFDAYYAMVRHTIDRLVADASLADDLAQEVFIRLWQKRIEIQIEGSLGGYLRRMAINEALAHLRRKQLLVFEERPEQQALASFERTDAALLQGELQQAIEQAIHALPSACRAVFQLSRQESMTYQEIATEMNISVKTVENQMSKALKILRSRLAGYFSCLL